MSKIWTRMGDGNAVEMTMDELRADIVAATEDAADKGKVPILEDNEIDKLVEIFSAPWRVIGVEPGHEVPLTKDETACTLISSQLSSGAHLPISREAAVEIFERVFAFDTMELGWIDYSFKPAKPMVSLDQVAIERLLATTVFPVLYGAMPNMGLYYTPDGPYTNPADLLGMMKVEEARGEEMKAAELCMEDMIYMCKRFDEIGADGIDFDTTASAGDADFWATLKTVEELKKTTNLGIEVGMSGEFILGMHGDIEYNGTKLAGLFPHQQLKVVEEAGADIFGPVVNTKTNKSAAWNVARAVTFVKEVCKQATIPIHANVGMGVGGTPMFETPPIDALSRASVAMVEIAKVDGLQVGVGDPFGMSVTHAIASGMGGIRTAGDLVARMQLNYRMRLPEAKKYVADKLHVSTFDLSDSTVMRNLREELDIGCVEAIPGLAKGLAAKARIADLLDIKIAAVEKLKEKMPAMA